MCTHAWRHITLHIYIFICMYIHTYNFGGFVTVMESSWKASVLTFFPLSVISNMSHIGRSLTLYIIWNNIVLNWKPYCVIKSTRVFSLKPSGPICFLTNQADHRKNEIVPLRMEDPTYVNKGYTIKCANYMYTPTHKLTHTHTNAIHLYIFTYTYILV